MKLVNSHRDTEFDDVFDQDAAALKEELSPYAQALHRQSLSDQATDRLMGLAASADAERAQAGSSADHVAEANGGKRADGPRRSYSRSVSRRKFIGFALGAAAVTCAGLVLSPFGPLSITAPVTNGFVLKAYAQDAHAAAGTHPINVATFTLHEADVEYESQLSHITCEFNLELAAQNVDKATYTLGDYGFTESHQPQATQAYAAFRKRESEFPKDSVPDDNPWFVSNFTASMNDQTTKSAHSDAPVFQKRLYIQAPFSAATKRAAQAYFSGNSDGTGGTNVATSSSAGSERNSKQLTTLATKDLFDLLEKTPLTIEVTYEDGSTERKTYLIKLTDEVKEKLASDQLKDDGFKLTEKDVVIVQE